MTRHEAPQGGLALGKITVGHSVILTHAIYFITAGRLLSTSSLQYFRGGRFADILIIKSALAGRSASGRIQANRSRPTSVGADFFDWGRIRRLPSAAAIASIPASLTEEKRAKGRACCPNRPHVKRQRRSLTRRGSNRCDTPGRRQAFRSPVAGSRRHFRSGDCP